MTKTIPLTQGLVAIVDDADYPELNRYNWCSSNSNREHVYAVRFGKKSDGDMCGHLISMHRQILKAPRDKVVDHINGNCLDNRRDNLRLATSSQNNRNHRVLSNSSTGFTGVSWHKKSRKFRAYIKHNGKQIALGYYRAAEDAARAHDQAAIKYGGEFAKTNLGGW